MKKKELWVLVANSTQAKLYRVENIKTLQEIADFAHPESRLSGHELVSDRPGRGYESFGPTRHAVEPKTDPKTTEFMIFAHELSAFLEEARKTNRYNGLYIAANPTFLGLIRQQLSSKTRQLIQGEVDKDLTQLKPGEILSHFTFSF